MPLPLFPINSPRENTFLQIFVSDLVESANDAGQ